MVPSSEALRSICSLPCSGVQATRQTCPRTPRASSGAAGVDSLRAACFVASLMRRRGALGAGQKVRMAGMQHGRKHARREGVKEHEGEKKYETKGGECGWSGERRLVGRSGSHGTVRVFALPLELLEVVQVPEREVPSARRGRRCPTPTPCRSVGNPGSCRAGQLEPRGMAMQISWKPGEFPCRSVGTPRNGRSHELEKAMNANMTVSGAAHDKQHPRQPLRARSIM